MTSTTDTGVADNVNGLSEDEAADAFLAHLTPEEGGDDAVKKKQPSEKDESKTTTKESDEKPEADTEEETSDESPEETSEDEADEKSEDADAKKYVDTDDVFVKVKVGDQELEYSVKDLKKYAGQEAALTRKSQALAEQVKRVDTEAQRYAAGLDAMAKRAESKANEFRQLNWAALAKDPNVTAEQLTILQNEARKALEEETFFKNELGQYVQAVNKQQQEQMAKDAEVCVKTLTDPASPQYIEGWNKTVYDSLMTFATSEGLSKEIAYGLTDPAAIKLLHMAMSYKAGTQKVVTTKKVDKTPKKIVKTSSAPPSTNPKQSQEKKAMARLKQTGSQADAENAFLARLQSHEQE